MRACVTGLVVRGGEEVWERRKALVQMQCWVGRGKRGVVDGSTCATLGVWGLVGGEGLRTGVYHCHVTG